jgi:hypothetical protein
MRKVPAAATHWQRFAPYLLPTSLLLALVVSLLTYLTLGPVLGVKSGYVFIGLAVALIAYGFSIKEITKGKSPPTFEPHSRSLRTAVYFSVLFSVIVVAGVTLLPNVSASIARTFVLLLVLPVSYALVLIQMYTKPSPKHILPQILVLFSLDLVTKFQSTDFYFGRGDIPKHVHYTDLVASSGTWRMIPETSFYHFFPGFQTLLGSVSLLTGLSPYDSLVITGICTYLVVVLAVYLLAQVLFDADLIPMCIALAVTMLGPIHRYSVYFYPQALAVALVSIVILAAFKYSSVGPRPYLGGLVLSSPIVVALWFTHHLTIVFFAPIILVLIVSPAVLNRILEAERVVRPQVVPLASLVVGSVIYWLYQDVFYSSLIRAFVEETTGASTAGSADAGSRIVSLGGQVPEHTVADAFISLFSPGGIYNITLVAALAFSTVVLLGRSSRYRRAGGLIIMGLLGSVFMIRLPIDIHGSARLQLPLSLFTAFVLGVGLRQILQHSQIKRVLPGLFVFVLLLTAGPAVAADDLYALQSGPDLWERHTVPDVQREFSDAEMESLQLSAGFIQQNDVSVGTDFHTLIGLSRYGTESSSFVVEDDTIRYDEDLLMYRQRWTEHSVRLTPERRSFITLVVPESWLNGYVASQNKVYTTGEVGMISDRGSRFAVE